MEQKMMRSGGVTADNRDNNYKEEEEVMLPGFRFHPTDEELVGFYLRRKVEKKPLGIELIKQIDLYKYDPWDLPKINTVGDKEWYFFCIRGRKYKNSIRPNRVTGSGFWKATGIDKPIYRNGESNECIGLKKSLVYYRGSAGKGTKTDWMMHEFRLPPSWKHSNHPIPKNIIIPQEAEAWTLCRIFKRNASHKKDIPDWKSSTRGSQNPSFIAEENCKIPTTVAFERLDKRNQLFTGGDHNSVAHKDPFTTSLWMPNTDNFLGDGNWDELRSVVELAVDPSNIYGYI